MELPLLQAIACTTTSARGYRLLPSSVVSANSSVQQVRVLDNLVDEMEDTVLDNHKERGERERIETTRTAKQIDMPINKRKGTIRQRNARAHTSRA
jgi:hypothetical protein